MCSPPVEITRLGKDTRETMAEDRRITAARRIAAHVAQHLKADLSLRLWNGEVVPLGPDAVSYTHLTLPTT